MKFGDLQFVWLFWLIPGLVVFYIWAFKRKAKLIERTGKDPFDVLAVDTSEVASASAAADELGRRGAHIDFLLLNAGASSKEPRFSSQGVEVTYASTLIGHHVLTMRALSDDTGPAPALACGAPTTREPEGRGGPEGIGGLTLGRVSLEAGLRRPRPA